MPLADVAAFRPSASKLVELVRHEGLDDDLPVEKGKFAVPGRAPLDMDHLKDYSMGRVSLSLVIALTDNHAQ